MSKLDCYGPCSQTINWIASCLMQCQQQVIVKGVSSKSCKAESSVSQLRVLGPLLFLTYINDLPQQVRSQVHLFTEDCLLYRPIKSKEDHVILKQNLNNLEKWGKHGVLTTMPLSAML